MVSEIQILIALGLVAAFQIKHFVCDGLLQTKAMVESKSKYGDKLGLVHAGIHGLGTAVVLIFWIPMGPTILALAFSDFLLHYHVDYSKENIVKRAGWTIADSKFWWALSADQTIHQLSYVALTYLAFTI